MIKKSFLQSIFIALIFVCLTANVAFAQTTMFTYQGKLTDGGNPASGNYLLQFKLFDAVSGGTQVGVTLTEVAVTATNGIFTTQLDFGASANAFPGADRFLEIAVRKNAGDPYTVLSPRQQITSSPYAIRALSADNANQLGGMNANQFIRNSTTQQTADFNINGNGVVGGNLGIGTQTPPVSKLDVRGDLTLDNGSSPVVYTSSGVTEQNRYFSLINSPTFRSASGLKAGGILVADDYIYANPGKNDLIVKGKVGIGVTDLFIQSGRLQVRDSNTAVYGEGVSGLGVSGYSSNSYGVYGESNSSIGVYGKGGNNSQIGVYGTSLNGFGVFAGGYLGTNRLGTGGSTALCLNSSNQIATCGSSLRYKTDLQPFGGGLNFINQLRPISFDWKNGGMKDVGFGAEDVARINPLFVTYNDKGEVEGVKYDRLSVVFVNAFKEQQAQIEQQKTTNQNLQTQVERQQREIDQLKQIVCTLKPDAAVCKETNRKETNK